MLYRFAAGICALLITAAGGFVVMRQAPREEKPIQTAVAAAVITMASTTATPTVRGDLYKVMKVVDGDTFVVSRGGRDVTLRLIGLDTPETVDPRKPVQCFGKEASQKAHELLDGKSVYLEFDVSQGELDKYGRTLAYAFLPDGTFFNKYMIAEGYAHEYTYNLPYRYQKQFKAAEVKAREEKRGLWADDACTNAPARSVPLSANPTGKIYDCSANIYNCSSFKTQAEAQYVFELCGLSGQGGDGNDVHKLDSDTDGRVCESLP